ncbi:Beige/BEACH domain containing protein [Trichomonas vaginalis G3]|uniref:Beige/BEACH domain containing protein n=1 Tax=Trichomonas vaginalis (strain ATCC PRA-98 / G3) TaxID=412133 RepID=A2E5Q6_TRIV3|nr:platelet formation protein family [Trichomonas vaginalis G3]EAY11976.1 Beige/BEACH domain containing protein [Trichomonas vaginalis G3]KAI5524859.1 platelet formation protein family [Trichomonas vaginalis G3]|eukprot:XP_001324199.1 Beige/BEACH domain containing protein [Trichomonas vaginalis G3]
MEHPQLLFSILSFSFLDNAEYEDLPDLVKAKNMPKKFPILKKADSTNLFAQIQKENNIKKALIDAQWPFPFDIEVLTTILGSFSLQYQKTPNYISLIILNSYVTFMISSFNLVDLPVLLENLRVFSKITTDHTCKQCASSAFVDLYRLIPIECSQSEFHQLLTPLFQFISDSEELHPQLFQILIKMFHLSMTYNSNVSSSMLNIVKLAINKFHSVIPDTDIVALLKILSEEIFEFHLDSFPLLQTITSNYEYIDLYSMILAATSRVVDEIHKYPPIFPMSDFQEESNRNKMFTRRKNPDITLSTVMHQDVYRFTMNIMNLMTVNAKVCDKFVASIIVKLCELDSTSPFAIDYLFVLALILKNTKKATTSADALPHIFRSMLFNVNADILDSNNFDMISLLKNEFFSLLFRSDSTYILEELQFFAEKSIHALFDIVYRISTDQVYVNPEKNADLLPVLTYIMNELKKITNTEYFNIYVIVYCDMILKLIKDKYAMLSFFQTADFFNILSWLIDISKYYTLKIESVYVHELKSKTSDLFNMNISKQMVKFFFFSITDERIGDAIIFMRFISDMVKVDNNNALIYKEIFFRIFQTIPTTCRKDLINTYIHLLLELLMYCSDKLVYSQQVMMKFEQSLEINYSDGLPWPIINDLINICAGQKVESMRLPFDLKQPKFFGVLLRLIKNDTEKLQIIIEIINLICQNFQNSRLLLHNHGIDAHIIDIIKDAKDDVLIDTCIAVIKQITSLVSSAAVVNKFVSLLLPINEKYFPRYQEKILTFLNGLITDALRQPLCGYTITKTSSPYVRGLKSEQFIDFSFSIWLYCTKTVQDAVIFTLHDANRLSFSLFIIKGCATIVINKGDDSWEGPLKLICPVNRWFILTATVEYQKNQNKKIVVTLELEGYAIRQLFVLHEFAPGDILFQLSNSMTNSENEVMVGPLSIFSKIPQHELQLLTKSNPHQMPTVPKTPFFFMLPKKDGEKISLSVNPEYQIVYKPIKNLQPFSILDVLSARIGYSVLVPLFAELNCTYEDGTKFDDFGIICINIIKNTLILNNRSQSELDTSKSFESISYLLSAMNPVHLTFDLYLSFFNLTTYITNKYLMKSLYRSIICNFDLWYLSSDKIKIFRHWESVLYTNYTTYARKALSFENLLMIMRTFFYYEPLETYLIHIREEEIDVELIRKLLMKCAYQCVKQKFKQNDVTFLGTQILTSVVSRQQNELIDLLDNIMDLPTIKGNDFETYSSLLMFHVLISTNNLTTIEKMFDIMIKMHEVFDITEVTLEEHLYMILEEIPQNLMQSEPFFEILFKFSKKKPEFLSLVCYVAQNLGSSYVKKVFIEIEPSPFLSKVHHWTVWPSLAFLTCPGDIRIHIIDFIIKCGCDLWIDAFSSIEHIGRSLGISVVIPKHDFLSAIAAKLLNQEITNNKKTVDTFLKLIKYFILMKPSGYISRYLLKKAEPIKLYEIDTKSPKALMQIIHNLRTFDGENKDLDFDLCIKDLQHQNSLATDLHLIMMNPIEKRKFGLTFNEEAIWIDSDIITMAFEIFDRSPLENHFGLMTVLAGLIVNEQPEIAHKFVDKYFIVINLLPEINVYNHRAIECNRPTVKKADPFLSFQKMSEVFEEFDSQNDPVVVFGVNYYNFVIECTEKSNFIITLSQGQYLKKMFNSASRIIENHSRSKFRYRLEWRKLWHRFIDDGSPWKNCISDKVVNKLRRKFTYCLPYYTPMKVSETRVQKDPDYIVTCPSNPFYDVLENMHSEILWSENLPPIDHDVNKNFVCQLINLDIIKNCHISVTSKSFLVYQQNNTYFKIHYDKIYSILQKPWRNEDNAIEILTVLGESYLFKFLQNRLPAFLLLIKTINFKSLQIPIQFNNDYIKYFNEMKLTEKWVNCQISTFEYLSMLNRYSGRTFHSTKQYPIFPWVLSDYFTDEYSLDNPSLIRMFALKMGNNLPSTSDDNLNIARMLSHLQPFNTLTKEKFNSIANEFINSSVNEIPPEFFCSPEIFEDVEKPKWAQNSFDFVYKHRKVLECELVSKQINKWIDTTFGSLQKSPPTNYPPKIIFKSKHPQRKNIPPPTYDKTDIKFCESNLICCVSILNPKTINLYAITENSELICAVANDKDAKTNMNNLSFRFGKEILPQFVLVNEDTFLCLKKTADKIMVIHSNSNIEYIDTKSFTSCIDANDMYTVVCDNDAIVHCYFSNDYTKPLFKLQTYTQSIKAVCASKNFHSIVCSTVDSQILIISITRKSISKSVYLQNFTSKKLIVTKSFGFIVVFGKGIVEGNQVRKIFIISCNGDILKEMIFNYKAIFVSTYVSSSGFDYVVFCDKIGKVFAFEAYYPERVISIGNVINKVLSFDCSENRVCVTTSNGQLHVFPFSF